MATADDYTGVDFPPMIAGNKYDHEFNFDRNLPAGVTIINSPPPVWSIWLIDGYDPAPSSRLTGTPTVDDETSQKTQQRVDVTAVKASAYYGLRAKIVTSTGQNISLSSRVRVDPPTP